MVLIGKPEGELTKKCNRFLSHPVFLNPAYGNDKGYSGYARQRTFATRPDGNVFLSPFSNQRGTTSNWAPAFRFIPIVIHPCAIAGKETRREATRLFS